MMNDVCRVCLDNGEDKSIFFVEIDKISGGNIDFATIIQIHGGVEVAKDDGLSQKICSNCIPKFTAAHSLWLMCQESDRKLREYHNRNNGSVDESVNEDTSEATDPLSHSALPTQSPAKQINIMKTEVFLADDPITDDNDEIDDTADNLADQPSSSSPLESDEDQDPSWNQPPPRKSRKKTEEPPQKCAICDFGYKKTEQLVRHLHSHKQESANQVYSILKSLRRKRLSNTENGGDVAVEEEDENNAEQTPEEFIKKIEKMIQQELDADGPGKSFTCAICYQSFVWKRSLIRHHGRVHKTLPLPEEEEQEFKCPICSRPFSKEWKLERHKKTHQPQSEEGDTRFKRFLCHMCSKSFRHKTGLNFHMRSHSGERPYICRFCGKGFASSSNCTNHERIHTGLKPYVCHFCNSAFAKSCTLKAHITTHTGEANYQCKTCGKSFKRLKYLKEHRYTHTGEKPYACKLCGTAYSHSGSLFAHEKRCKTLYGVEPSSRKRVERITDSTVAAVTAPPATDQ